MTAPLIGLIGKKRSGKDSFARTLVDELGFRRFAFADPMKAGILELDPWVKVEPDEVGPLLPEVTAVPTSAGRTVFESLRYLVGAVGWERAKELREVRRLLQEYGNGIRNHAGMNVWVDGLMADVELYRTGEYAEDLGCGCCFEPVDETPVVITDVRYPNEAEAVKAAGGTLVRIIRPGLVSDDSHISETALDDWPVDATALNDRDLESLARQARCLLGILS